MNNKKEIIKPISQITTAAMLSTFIYLAPVDNNKIYASPNETTITQTQVRTNIKTGKIKPCDYLNVRSGPGVKNSVVGKVYTNETVQILEVHSNGWYKIKIANQTIGWASGKYIEVQGNNTSNPNQNTNVSDKAKNIVDFAHKQIGKPYAWGASGPNAFDCSGFTSYVYKNAGINLPRVSRQQATVGTTISKSQLKPGDLVFFSSNGSSITHVGLYIGDSKMIHSPSPDKTVRIESINSSYYSRTYMTAKSII